MLGRILTTIISITMVLVGLELSGPDPMDAGSMSWWSGLALSVAGVLLFTRMADITSREDQRANDEHPQ